VHVGFLTTLGFSLALGLRHALDPDHLSAVATITAGDAGLGTKRATRIGLAWGAGHALSLLALGIPVVIAGPWIPHWIHATAEVAIGAIIAWLAARLLVRWRRGELHLHAHSHEGLLHEHLHAHASEPTRTIAGDHGHAHPKVRSPRAAFGVGLVHGVGGSAPGGIIMVAAAPDRTEALIALCVFAAGTALSMAIASGLAGLVLARAPVARRFAFIAPIVGACALVFGVWYALAGLSLVPGSVAQ
jgi:cytochrome c biogenesis protein CcdA